MYPGTVLALGLLIRPVFAALPSFDGDRTALPIAVPAFRFQRAEPPALDAIRLTPEQALEVGLKIWQNEGGRKVSALTHWNAGEGFASVGIGHFLWYPPEKAGPFTESFPWLLRWLEAHGADVPAWLRGGPHCPWPDREAFFAAFESPRMVELRNFLAATVPLQAEFMAERMSAALPAVLAAAKIEERAAVDARFRRVAAAGGAGVYALVDYVNFKGEGTNEREAYRGQGWGLLQVLLNMKDRPDVLVDFSDSADFVLTRRVANAPPERHEERWLPVWRRRVATYRAP